MTFTVADATLITVAGLAIKELTVYLVKRKENGKDKASLNIMQADIGQIKTAVADIPLINNKISEIKSRCGDHLASQEKTNLRIEERVDSVEGKMFNHINNVK